MFEQEEHRSQAFMPSFCDLSFDYRKPLMENCFKFQKQDKVSIIQPWLDKPLASTFDNPLIFRILFVCHFHDKFPIPRFCIFHLPEKIISGMMCNCQFFRKSVRKCGLPSARFANNQYFLEIMRHLR